MKSNSTTNTKQKINASKTSIKKPVPLILNLFVEEDDDEDDKEEKKEDKKEEIQNSWKIFYMIYIIYIINMLIYYNFIIIFIFVIIF